MISQETGPALSGQIFNIQRFCLHDGPGIRTVVFFKGCPLRCLWCHNPESQCAAPVLFFREELCRGCGRCLGLCEARSLDGDKRIRLDRSLCTLCGKCAAVCPSGASELSGRTVTAAEVMDCVRRDRRFYESSGGGLTLSGGEPAAQPEFALALLEAARAEGIGTAVETSGAGPLPFFLRAGELGARFLFDLKTLDRAAHLRLTGADNRPILANLDALLQSGAPVILRLPLIPGMNDGEEELEALTDFLRARKGLFERAELMPYHRLGEGKSRQLGREAAFTAEPPDAARLLSLKERFAAEGLPVTISGTD